MTAPLPMPGRGAAHLAPPRGHFVYVVRSQRSGGISVGIDLTPEGACPLACDYCQVGDNRTRWPSVDVELETLRRELEATLDEHGSSVKDVVFAGSGEPTWSGSFRDALEIAVALAAPRGILVRVYTSGALHGRPRIRDALAELVRERRGEVWVKLDSWDDPSLQQANGIHGQDRHEDRILALAREVPVVIQSMIVRRAAGPEISEVAEGLAGAIDRLLVAGARIDRVELTTLLREAPRDPTLEACDQADLAEVSAALAATGVVVRSVTPP